MEMMNQVWSVKLSLLKSRMATDILTVHQPTFKRIVITKSTEQFSGLPYIYALLNCLICSWYGLPVVKTGIILVATVNSVVAVFQLVYLSMFIRYTERAIKLRMMGLIAAIFVVFAFVVFVSLGLLDYDERQTFVRYLSVASLISMFASPLFIIKLVIKTRSVEFMPFNLSLATFLMSLSFSAYGVFKKDPFPLCKCYIPNGIGTILGLVQLALYSYYNNVSGDALREPLIVSYA
ncbi:bidirectional sugar transporter SWEET2a-like [Malus sylvestris]|uniref:bidirectional sugar transporter SWEET2a-like n=1 Tax=Malus sylvestris TaxID=3752 RepID=UPI0021AC666F|nr:bidirectional sugar transporter SWEET2a-like [Malus sylvestris]